MLVLHPDGKRHAVVAHFLSLIRSPERCCINYVTIVRKPAAGLKFILLDRMCKTPYIISWLASVLLSFPFSCIFFLLSAVFSLNRNSPCPFFFSSRSLPHLCLILTPSVSNFLSHSLEEDRLSRRRCSLVNEFFLPVSQVRAQALS